ncbi:hypothetical protein ACFX12_023663 [Malus domestica]
MRKNSGMEEPCTTAPKLPKIMSIQSYLSAKEKSWKNGRLCSFFFSASGNVFASAAVSAIAAAHLVRIKKAEQNEPNKKKKQALEREI